MNKRSLSTLGLTLMTFSSVALALETYVVRRGDYLSGILRKKYPKEQIYGPNGSLSRLLHLNPKVKNKNFVLPGETIVLPDFEPLSVQPAEESETQVMSEAPAPIESPVEAVMSEETPPAVEDQMNWISRFWVAGLYGARYNSIGQRGTLGDADSGEFNFKNVQGIIGYSHKDLDIEASWEQFNLYYQQANSSAHQNFHNLNLNFIFKDLILNWGQNQSPIIYNHLGNITYTPQTQSILGLGLRKKYEFLEKYFENMELRGLARFPLSQSLNDNNIKSSGLNGYGFHGQINFSHKIKESDAYQLDLLWNNQVSWQKSSQSIYDGTSSKSLDTNFTNASSYVGLKLKLK